MNSRQPGVRRAGKWLRKLCPKIEFTLKILNHGSQCKLRFQYGCRFLDLALLSLFPFLTYLIALIQTS